MEWLDLSVKPNNHHESYYFYNPKKIGVSTLENLGNTCYFNSVLQCLCHTYPLTNYILKGKYNSDDKLLAQFARLVKTMWYGNYKLTPSSIYTHFRLLTKKVDDNQEDAHEVLDFLLNHFHEALKYPVHWKDLNDNHKHVKESLVYLKNEMMSPINNIFMGQLHKRTQCQVCRNTTNSFEIFRYIVVPPETHDNYQHLYTLLKNYCHRQTIEDYECEKCNKKQPAFQKTTFWRLPQVLIIVLARFNCYPFKNNKKVDYPINTLNMTKYVTYPDETLHIFNLYAVSCHLGNRDIGHYYTISKINDDWVILNDDAVEYVSKKDQLITAHAYMLFYQRQSYT